MRAHDHLQCKHRHMAPKSKHNQSTCYWEYRNSGKRVTDKLNALVLPGKSINVQKLRKHYPNVKIDLIMRSLQDEKTGRDNYR